MALAFRRVQYKRDEKHGQAVGPEVERVHALKAQREWRDDEDRADQSIDGNMQPIRQNADNAGLVVGEEGQREGCNSGRDRQP